MNRQYQSSGRRLGVWTFLRVGLVAGLVGAALSGPGFGGRARGAAAATCVTNPVVISLADSGPGSLREAITDACPGSTITFAVTGTITLTSGELDIDQSLTIQGPGATVLTVDGNKTALHVFNVGSVNPGLDVTISGLMITGGNANTSLSGLIGGGILYNGTKTLNVNSCNIAGNEALFDGGAIFNNLNGTLNVSDTVISGKLGDTDSAGIGGGIYNAGVANVFNCIFSGINASEGGGIENSGGTLFITGSTISGGNVGVGGGLENDGFATITDCTISGVTAALGGGLSNDGFATIVDTTISGNVAENGGGIRSAGGAITIVNGTISGNTARPNVGGIGGGVIIAGGTLTLQNTIIAANNASGGGPDISGAIVSQGHNLIGKADGSTGLTNGVNGDQVGSIASPINPRLGPLQNNGGPTATLALLSGSPAIDAGDDSVLGAPLLLTTDQRGPGFPRKSGAHVDIGAFEFQPFDTCLKDSTGNLLQWNSATGAYTFTRCSDGFTISGTGTVALVSGMRTLTDNKPDRRISAALNTGQRTGTATIYWMAAQGVWQLFRINDTDPSAVCACQR